MSLVKHGLRAAVAALAMASAGAPAVEKCIVDGKTIFQEAPCDESRDTVGATLARRQRHDAYHRYLDELAAQGEGRVHREAHEPAPKPALEDPRPPIHARSRSNMAEMRRRRSEALQEQAERQNAQSAAALTRTLDEAHQACGGKLAPRPTVGMTDAHFRNCTIHARFGGVTQIVAAEQDGVPLRLYIFPTRDARRVYSVGGIVTAVK